MCALLAMYRVTDDADWEDGCRFDCGAALAMVEPRRQKGRKMDYGASLAMDRVTDDAD